LIAYNPLYLILETDLKLVKHFCKKCHLRIKTAPFLMDLKFKGAHFGLF